MKKLTLVVVMYLASQLLASSQGCVAIRSTGGVCMLNQEQHADMKNEKWNFNMNNRYFKSFRHFVGTEEQKQRVEQGTEVINHSFTTDLALTRKLNAKWSLSVDVPIISNKRSSLYEHGGKARHSTESFGIGDVRLTGYYWVVDPSKMSKGNVQLGAGIKLPTGDYKYQDYFYTATGDKVVGPVDQSIQLGDGGTGFTTEVNAFYHFTPSIGMYGSFFYLVNPREQNGTSTARGSTPSASSIAYGSNVMSVPDQWMLRGGFNFLKNNFMASLGVRDECLPVHDLVGGSNGFRRPGYIISLEPGLTYQFKKISVYSFVPVALVRNRTQSVPDKIRTEMTGVYAQGDAAFADYTVNLGFAVRF